MTILEALLFFLPAGMGNMAPILVNKIPILNKWTTPLDFGNSYRSIRILGNNKTWRGLISGTIAGGLVALLVMYIYPNVPLSFGAGCILGFGALLGDAVESFFKRQKRIPPGESWFPFDQTDYIVGGLLLATPFTILAVPNAIAVFVTYFGLHLFFSYLGFLLKLKDKPI